MNKIGVLLCGGKGTRLEPITISTNKHLLPLYDKPLFYYSLCTLILSGIKEIKIVTNVQDKKFFEKHLEYFQNDLIKFEIITQNKPLGILDALKKVHIKEKGKDILLILGDNIIYGKNISNLLHNTIMNDKSTIYSKTYKNNKEHGVIKFSKNKIIKIIEKPKKFISDQSIIGIYYYNNKDLKFINKIKKSKRNEYEITDFNNLLIKIERINLIKLERGITWIDAGTHETFFEASNLIKSIEIMNQYKFGVVEEAILRMGGNLSKFKKNKNSYYKYINDLF